MPDPTAEIPVTYEDLEGVHRTLSTLHSFCLSQDLVNQYKNVSNRLQASPLTKHAEQARDRIFGYMQYAIEDDDVSEKQRVDEQPGD